MASRLFLARVLSNHFAIFLRGSPSCCDSAMHCSDVTYSSLWKCCCSTCSFSTGMGTLVGGGAEEVEEAAPSSATDLTGFLRPPLPPLLLLRGLLRGLTPADAQGDVDDPAPPHRPSDGSSGCSRFTPARDCPPCGAPC
jgi:hypothetical protein